MGIGDTCLLGYTLGCSVPGGLCACAVIFLNVLLFLFCCPFSLNPLSHIAVNTSLFLLLCL